MSGSFGIGSALGTGSRLWLRNLPACAVFAIVAYLPLIAFDVVVKYTPLGEVHRDVFVALYELHPQAYQLAFGALFALAFAVGGAAVTWRTVTALDGARASIGRCLAHVGRRILVVVGVALVAHLAVDGTRAIVTALVLADPQLGIPISLPAIIASQVLELVLSVGFVLALAVAVGERIGVVGAIARGWRLSVGVRAKLFVLLLALAVLALLIHALVRQLLVPALLVEAADVRARLELVRYVSMGLSLVLMTLQASVSAVAYAQLRADREGPSERELARVFD